MGAPRRFDPKALVGKSLQQGRYALKQFLGQGSFAYVYRAEEMLGGQRLRDVAVKWIIEGDIEQIVREAQALAAMPPHANIVGFLTTLALAPPAPGLMLVLEFVEGQPMDKLMADGKPRSCEDTAAVMDHILKGLAHAHAHKVIHRDLKPENVMARSDGTLKITDFGIARNTQPGKATSGDVIKGTPAYMAPEQFGKQHDHRVDLYAAGVMIFELLTGNRPFDGTPIEIMKGHVLEAPPIPEDLPQPLRVFLARSLAKDPNDRFENAELMRASLHLAVEEVTGKPSRKHSSTIASLTGLSPEEGLSSTPRKPVSTSVSPRKSGPTRPPPEIEIFADSAPAAELPWPEGATDRRLIGAVLEGILPGASELAARAASELEIAATSRRPVWRLSRKRVFERRVVVERFTEYTSERLPRAIYDTPEQIDPWDVVFTVERPTVETPSTDFRIKGTERQTKCITCRGRGRTICQACNGKDSMMCMDCYGKPEQECAECRGMGDRIGYLVIEAHREVQDAMLVEKHPALTSEVISEDLQGATATTLLCGRCTELKLEDLPQPLPWPELAPAVAALFEDPTPEGAQSVSDELAIDWVAMGRLECRLGGADAALEAIPEAGFACCDERFSGAVRGWVARLIANQALWDKEPPRMMAHGCELLEGEGGKAWIDPVQSAALALAGRLLDSGQTARFRELRHAFSALLAYDKDGKWKGRWAAMLSERRKTIEARFHEALDGKGKLERMAESLSELEKLDSLAQEAPALFKAAIGRAQELIKKNDFLTSDPLVRALGALPWPMRGASDVFGRLTLEALESRCKSGQKDCEAGAEIEPLFREISALLALCPELKPLAALVRSMRQRLDREFKEGSIVAGFQWGRRLQEELSHLRPDLASLFSNLMEGNEGAYIDSVRRTLSEPKGFPESIELMTLPEVRLQGDERVLELAQAFDKVFGERCESVYAVKASKGPLSEEVESELTRAMGAWMRVQGWLPDKPLQATFVPALWQVFEILLRSPQFARAQPLLDLAEQIACIRDHPEIGPLIQFSRDSNADEAAAAARQALKEDKFDAFAGPLEKMLRAMPKHAAVSAMMNDFQAHLKTLALSGRMQEILDRATRIRDAIQARKLPEGPWLRDPVNQLAGDVEMFALANGALPDKIEDVLQTIVWLRDHDCRWVSQLAIRLDQSVERMEDSAAMMHRLALIPGELIDTACEPRSTLGLIAGKARQGLDRKMRKAALWTLLPLSLEVWPRVFWATNVVPVPFQKVVVTLSMGVTWAVMAVSAFVLADRIPPLTRMVMGKVDRNGNLWRPLSIAFAVAASLAVFGAGALATKLLGPSR